jgi:GPH family glycoside/pentoside/hexuronide:cation symporter
MKTKQEGYSRFKAVAFGCGHISEQTAYQSFTLLVFTFYFSIVGINIFLISLGFIIWSIWNSLNDPILGYISDRTHTRWGRRRPFIMIALIPLGIIMLLLFTPPIILGINAEIINFIYFIAIIIIFELFYTMFSLNMYALFPEGFITEKERTEANNIRQVLIIFGLIFAFILPGLIIPDATNAQYIPQYFIFGIVIGIIIIIGGIISLKFGIKEKVEFQNEYKNIPSFTNSIKYCLKNKSFMWYIPAEIANWFVYGMLAVIVILYAKFVLNVNNTLIQSLLLGLAFISAVLFMTILWKPVVKKIGLRKSWMISMSIWIITLIPLLFIDNAIAGMIVFFLVGMGLSGSFFVIDLIISDIIDEDEVNTGVRRDAGYYGINSFFSRLSSVFVFLAIGVVFTYTGWFVYEPEKVTAEIVFGLRLLMCIFPILALGIAIMVMYKYPLHGKRLSEVKEKLQKIHEKKKLMSG